jgi:hypothetical protein
MIEGHRWGEQPSLVIGGFLFFCFLPEMRAFEARKGREGDGRCESFGRIGQRIVCANRV